jgi:hypothetical protein
LNKKNKSNEEKEIMTKYKKGMKTTKYRRKLKISRKGINEKKQRKNQ